MAKRTSREKNVIKYLLLTVIVLLVIVSLLSLFIFKSVNPNSENVVLGTTTGPVPSSLTCATCVQLTKGSVAIILQQNGTNAKTWGAMCATQTMLSTVKYVAKIVCPTPIPTPKPTLTPKLTCTPRPTCIPKSGIACPTYVGTNACPPSPVQTKTSLPSSSGTK